MEQEVIENVCKKDIGKTIAQLIPC